MKTRTIETGMYALDLDEDNYDLIVWDTRLSPEFKKAWVEALRSGDFEQTYGILREDDGFESRHCCVGVAVEVACKNFSSGISENQIVSWQERMTRGFGLPLNGFASWLIHGTTPDSFAYLMDARVPPGDVLVRVTLYDLNDSGQFTFSQIADLIDYFL